MKRISWFWTPQQVGFLCSKVPVWFQSYSVPSELYWNLSNIACLEASTKISTYLNYLEPSFQSQGVVLLFNVYLHKIMLSNTIKKERWVLRVYTKQCMNKNPSKVEVPGIKMPETAKILRVQRSPILKSPPSPWVILQKYKLFNWNELQESVMTLKRLYFSNWNLHALWFVY